MYINLPTPVYFNAAYKSSVNRYMQKYIVTIICQRNCSELEIAHQLTKGCLTPADKIPQKVFDVFPLVNE